MILGILRTLYADFGPMCRRIKVDCDAPVRSAKQAGARVSRITVLTTIGTPLDVSAQDLTIDYLFPADDATERRFRSAR